MEDFCSSSSTGNGAQKITTDLSTCSTALTKEVMLVQDSTTIEFVYEQSQIMKEKSSISAIQDHSTRFGG